jgi:hypothetical protein
MSMCGSGRSKSICLNYRDERRNEMHGKREIDNMAGSVDCGETADRCISVSL